MTTADRLTNMIMTAEALDKAEAFLRQRQIELIRRSMKDLQEVADHAGVNLLMILNEPHEDPIMEVTTLVGAHATDRLKLLSDEGQKLVKRLGFRQVVPDPPQNAPFTK